MIDRFDPVFSVLISTDHCPNLIRSTEDLIDPDPDPAESGSSAMPGQFWRGDQLARLRRHRRSSWPTRCVVLVRAARFEVTEDPSAGVDGQRFRLYPLTLGLQELRAPTVTITSFGEDAARANGRRRDTSLAELDSALGTAWDEG